MQAGAVRFGMWLCRHPPFLRSCTTARLPVAIPGSHPRPARSRRPPPGSHCGEHRPSGRRLAPSLRRLPGSSIAAAGQCTCAARAVPTPLTGTASRATWRRGCAEQARWIGGWRVLQIGGGALSGSAPVDAFASSSSERGALPPVGGQSLHEVAAHESADEGPSNQEAGEPTAVTPGDGVTGDEEEPQWISNDAGERGDDSWITRDAAKWQGAGEAGGGVVPRGDPHRQP